MDPLIPLQLPPLLLQFGGWPFIVAASALAGLLLGLLVQVAGSGWLARLKQARMDLLAVRAVSLVVGLLLANLLVALLVLQPLPWGMPLLKPAIATAANLLFGIAALSLGESCRLALLRLLRPRTSETLLLAEGVVQRSAPKIVDSSAAIDGRIAALLDSGLLEGQVIIPQVVLEELQKLADSGKGEKRLRGRRGLENLSALRERYGRRVVTNTTRYGGETVDEKLLQLTGDTDGILISTDYNLAKVGRLRDLDVLCLSELIVALRPNAQPGDAFHLKLVREGKEPHQAIGYLEDGTMVVVDRARALVGQARDVTITGALQTSSGRMVFARLNQQEDPRGQGLPPETEQSSRSPGNRSRHSR